MGDEMTPVNVRSGAGEMDQYIALRLTPPYLQALCTFAETALCSQPGESISLWVYDCDCRLFMLLVLVLVLVLDLSFASACVVLPVRKQAVTSILAVSFSSLSP